MKARRIPIVTGALGKILKGLLGSWKSWKSEPRLSKVQ